MNRLAWRESESSLLRRFGVAMFWIVRNHRILEQHKRLRRAVTMPALGELTASVAHNIRNPLASIHATTGLVLELRTLSDAGNLFRLFFTT